MDAMHQEPRQRVQLYYDKLDRLFVKGRILNAKRCMWFLARLRPQLRKLLVIRIYQDMDELLVATIEIKKVIGKIGKTFYEPLQEEREEELALGKTSIDKHLQALNDTLVNYFGRGTDGKINHNLGSTSTIQCQLCKSNEHTTFACPKLANLRPKCVKCDKRHRIEIVV